MQASELLAILIGVAASIAATLGVLAASITWRHRKELIRIEKERRTQSSCERMGPDESEFGTPIETPKDDPRLAKV